MKEQRNKEKGSFMKNQLKLSPIIGRTVKNSGGPNNTNKIHSSIVPRQKYKESKEINYL